MSLSPSFYISVPLHFPTIAIALKDVASQILSNAAGLGKEITASTVATGNVFRHEPKVVGMDLKHQVFVIYYPLKRNHFKTLNLEAFLCIIIIH